MGSILGELSLKKMTEEFEWQGQQQVYVLKRCLYLREQLSCKKMTEEFKRQDPYLKEVSVFMRLSS